MRLHFVIACAVCFAVGFPAGMSFALAECLPYEPASVAVAGKLERRTYPGRPNYESIAKGDEPETGYYLVLPSPVCTAGVDAAGTLEPHKNVRLIQLVLDKPGYEQVRPHLGKSVRVRGRLFSRLTAHHHAPVLLTFERIENER